MTEYDAYPDHPLAGVPQKVLDVARQVLDDAVMTKDVDPEQAHPIADSVVAALREAGHIKRPGEAGGEMPWGNMTPMLAVLRLPIPVEGMDPLLNAMRIIYGEPVRIESKGAFLVILQQLDHSEGESDSH